MSCTVTSAACKVAQDFISKNLVCANIIDYHKIYSGVKELSNKLRLTLQNQFARNSVRFPINDAANPKVWEVKHEQTDLLNLTTRGNASLTVADPEHNILGGVIARNGAGSENPDLPKESFANRKAFILSVASRTGKISATYKQYTLLSEMQKTNCPYTESSHLKNLSMDFDMKRKPVKESLRAEYLEIDGEKYEVAHIETVPFENNAEYLLYKAVADKQQCLRTVADWLRFCHLMC